MAVSTTTAPGDQLHGNNGNHVMGVVSNNKISQNSYPSGGGSRNFVLRRRSLEISAAVFLGIAVCCLVLYRSLYSSAGGLLFPGYLFSISRGSSSLQAAANRPEITSPVPESSDPELMRVLKNATRTTGGPMSSLPSRTVILTTLNSAWAEPGSILDLFLESFRAGNGTHDLVDNLVIISLDQKAHQRCQAIHPHCYALTTPGVNFTGEAYFMTSEYLLMMWRRIDFLASILRLGYDFVFTDADIMWFRNPFPHFHKDADFQIACDQYTGQRNRPNGGFTFVRSNVRTLQFYRFWYHARHSFPGMHDQDVLNKIKFDPFLDAIGLKVRFLDTAYFGGFCEPARNLNWACTMHANCCVGLGHKIHDLNVVLGDWKHYMSLPADSRGSASLTWRAPQRCRYVSGVDFRSCSEFCLFF
ncbi:unnamed protein product [Linum tenue]|uniref:Glycosyltransferase n=1 Tax=Linum tenue TaxID=586396 RepID=A0AAV0IU68_9ROSI|nr:unnamed protein product [Linum tenue]